MSNHVKIAIDAMGNDLGPEEIISGAALSKERCPEAYFVFFGEAEKLKKILYKYKILNNSYKIVGANEMVLPRDKLTQVIKKRKETSMGMALEYLSRKEVDALVSAGNTGALMGMAKIQLKTLEGIDRPAIAATIPHQKGEFVLLDLGANTDCNAKNLAQFAIMGSEFAKVVLGINEPKISILNIGTEKEKGKLYIKDAADILKNSYLSDNYVGFVEGNEMTTGKVDVVVTDGFSGNIALKTAEGVAKLCSHYIKLLFSSSIAGKISYFIVKRSLGTLGDKLDPRKRNGALFLGINGIVVKSHGGADALSFASAIEVAFEFTQGGVGAKITKSLNSLDRKNKE